MLNPLTRPLPVEELIQKVTQQGIWSSGAPTRRFMGGELAGGQASQAGTTAEGLTSTLASSSGVGGPGSASTQTGSANGYLKLALMVGGVLLASYAGYCLLQQHRDEKRKKEY